MTRCESFTVPSCSSNDKPCGQHLNSAGPHCFNCVSLHTDPTRLITLTAKSSSYKTASQNNKQQLFALCNFDKVVKFALLEVMSRDSNSTPGALVKCIVHRKKNLQHDMKNKMTNIMRHVQRCWTGLAPRPIVIK